MAYEYAVRAGIGDDTLAEPVGAGNSLYPEDAVADAMPYLEDGPRLGSQPPWRSGRGLSRRIGTRWARLDETADGERRSAGEERP
jgi:hypothetical protein